tara:strand:+ start:11097 stop:11234 length:138 start_codon:yes stop_codon:yes gene_type:complete
VARKVKRNSLVRMLGKYKARMNLVIVVMSVETSVGMISKKGRKIC